ARGGVLEPRLHMDAVGPEVDVMLGGEIPLAPARMLLRPGLLEPSDGGRRQPAGILAEQRGQHPLELAGGNPLEVEDRDQHLEALRPARVGRQNRRREADALQAFANAITHARAAHSAGADAGHDPPLGQMPVTDQPLAAVLGQLVSMTGEQGCSLGLDCLGQQRSRAVAQHRGQRISKSSGWESWKTLVSVTAYHSFGGEVELRTPHDTPPHLLMPSPTFAHSSLEWWPPSIGIPGRD